MEGMKNIHFIGIGGYGMSAIAKIMIEKGYNVTGSDLNKSKIVDRLTEEGAEISIGHRKENLRNAELVVYSTAIPDSNPELAGARDMGLVVYHRSEMLAKILNQSYGIAIAGAHGKTTTTSMTSLVLEQGGKDPTALIGGELSNFESNARLGKSNIVVAEADESDNSFLRYNPKIALVTNIEADHLEHYNGDFNNLLDSYYCFLGNVADGGKAIVNFDDENVRHVLSRVVDKNIITYGLNTTNEYFASNINLKKRGSSFDLYHKGQKLGNIELVVPGQHNILNAMGAAVIGLLEGVAFSDIKNALKSFQGAKRRFQVVYDEDILVVDDYAHHPTEIRATLEATKDEGYKRTIAIFQPQRYTRTKALMEEFAQSFYHGHKVIIADVYSAGELPLEGANAETLVAKIRASGHKDVQHIKTNDEIYQYLIEQVETGDLVITMGAGDVYKVSHRLGEFLSNRK